MFMKDFVSTIFDKSLKDGAGFFLASWLFTCKTKMRGQNFCAAEDWNCHENFNKLILISMKWNDDMKKIMIFTAIIGLYSKYSQGTYQIVSHFFSIQVHFFKPQRCGIITTSNAMIGNKIEQLWVKMLSWKRSWEKKRRYYSEIMRKNDWALREGSSWMQIWKIKRQRL